MIRFHYMASTGDLSIQGLSDLSDKLDRYGYYSVLLVYSPYDGDFLIKVASILNKNHKIKYMPAIRTYALSPEYFGKICKAFDEIQKDRLMVNIVSGNIEKDENFLEDIVGIKSFIQSKEQRLFYTEEWIKKFLSLRHMDSYPEIAMSGNSDKTIEMARDNRFTHIVNWHNYQHSNERERYSKNHNTMVNFALVIRDSKEEAQQFLNKLSNQNAKYWTIAGTEEDFKEHVLYLSSLGIKDIQITTFSEDDQIDRIHNTIKEMRKSTNG